MKEEWERARIIEAEEKQREYDEWLRQEVGTSIVNTTVIPCGTINSSYDLRCSLHSS